MSLSEEWRPIPGHEGYGVSNLGRVRGPHGIIKGHSNGGYRRVQVGKMRMYVHQLVLEAFVGPRPNGRDYARHLNGDRTDNRLENLAWQSTVPAPDTLAGRFAEKVDKSGGVEGCWMWTGSKNQLGYGQIWDEGRLVFAHRAAWKLANGPIPDGMMMIDHRCHTPACVNPKHLRLATSVHNSQHRRGAQANSQSGHRGVSWDSSRGKWAVRAKADGKYHFGGRYDDLAEAVAASEALRDRLMTHHDSTAG